MNAFLIAGLAGVVAIVPIPVLQAVLAVAASTLFESTPFILAAALIARLAPRGGPFAAALLACGCSGGPSARSIPVAVATFLTLGPLVAALRWIAGLLAGRILRKKSCLPERPSYAADLHALMPCALASGALLSPPAASAIAHLHPLQGAAAAAILAAFASPCGFGAIALAATLRHTAPAAAFGVLAVAGICDVRALRGLHPREPRHDGLSYFIAAIACALIAFHHGNTLVNPRFTAPLWICAFALCGMAVRYRHERLPASWWAPSLMLAAALISTPQPAYYATETTLDAAFAGEAIDFRGALASDGHRASLNRLAIVCCRADAQPIAVRLLRPLREPNGQWVRATGKLVRAEGGLALEVGTYQRIAAPADPFVYR